MTMKGLCPEGTPLNARGRESEAERLGRIVEGAVLIITRYLLLLRIGPVGFRSRDSSLDPTTIRGLAYDILPKLFAVSIASFVSSISANEADVPADFLRHVPLEYVDSLAKTAKRRTVAELQRMFMLESMGLWNQVPVLEHDNRRTTPVAGPGKPKTDEDKSVPYQPLPDDYVAAMGARSLWLIENIGPVIIPVLRKMKEIYVKEDKPELGTKGVRTRRRRKLKEFLSGHVWKDREGNTIESLPFPIYSPNTAGRYSKVSGLTPEAGAGDAEIHRLAWPPKLPSEVFAIANTVQLAHMFLVGMTLAGRKGEIISLERNCVRYARNGRPYANGKTYKLVERHGGEWRDWILPDIAAAAIEQQVRLVRALETIGNQEPERSVEREKGTNFGTHLWSQSGIGYGDRASPLLKFNWALGQYARTLCLETHPGGMAFTSHRLRKTVARLVALALTQAPKILMRVFGHKAVEMTMTYIMTDKGLRAEIEQLCRELRVMRATEVVQKMIEAEDAEGPSLVNGGFGGPAATTFRQAVAVQKEGLHHAGMEWGAENAKELAEVLTLQGKAWHYVRPGIICTKFPGTEAGPCNKSRGHPEPARCQTHCRHRLEEAFLREDVDGAIRDSIKAYNEASVAGEDLMRESWAGQIRMHIRRFEDIRAKWSNDPTVQLVLNEVDHDGAVT
ncbi:hypothetical protein [Paraburkholderia sp. MM5384-R2]|uniref:hypothetical protein n=1 Tax=Paraburkholderia sp. MM5384-R2 TaxID=2723097 RepID=UPI001613CF67|nr:hypothetical protein [Paraburkholderia sp. MM5384-R2]